ncbi:MAG: peptide deformylase [Firmicutes bacterium]|nr:peptide deformylase [Bacillota bacterium]
MAIREIRLEGDEILTKKCKEVKLFNERLHTLLDDMYETMTKAGGVGLTGPQVGVLKRVVVIDVGETPGENKIELVNPEIIESEGSQRDSEGCLSVPDIFGIVERPKKVTVRAQDRYGKWFKLTGEDLLARAICHETDHLEGIIFREHVIEYCEKK